MVAPRWPRRRRPDFAPLRMSCPGSSVRGGRSSRGWHGSRDQSPASPSRVAGRARCSRAHQGLRTGPRRLGECALVGDHLALERRSLAVHDPRVPAHPGSSSTRGLACCPSRARDRPAGPWEVGPRTSRRRRSEFGSPSRTPVSMSSAAAQRLGFGRQERARGVVTAPHLKRPVRVVT